MITLDRLDLALGLVGGLGALVCLARVAAILRATLFDLGARCRLVRGPELDGLEEALLALASQAPGGELRAGVLEDGSLLVLPAVAGRCLVVPSEAPFRHLSESLYFIAQPLPMRVLHGPPGAQAEAREVILYRLALRGWKAAKEVPAAALGGELSRRSYSRATP